MSENEDVNKKQAINQAAPVKNIKREEENQEAVGELSKLVGKDEAINVKVHSPYRLYYEGRAFSISAVNDTGPFDILPQHFNFICLLQPCKLIIRTVSDGTQQIDIGGGVMHVKADSVIVFLDI
ncbi:hypothetical protein EBZ57_01285 [bacterium]|nr:hypothetical protein [bacterium]